MSNVTMRTTEPVRRLSLWRVMLAIAIVVGLSAAGVMGLRGWQDARSLSSNAPWFAAYVDVTSTPTFAFDQLGATNSRDAVLSFIVSSTKDACTPSWGNAYTMEQAGNTLDLDRRIARLQQQGGSVAVSFGGLNNDELAVRCTDNGALKRAYKSVIDRYKINTIDLDLEGSGLVDGAVNTRRATVLAGLQQEYKKADKPLAIWVTLPVIPQGLSEDGTDAVAQLLKNGVDLAGVNIMTMDYGASKPKDDTMAEASKNALIQTVRQMGVLYKAAGIHLSNATLWSKIGATPMIGQNDIRNEVFTLDDAKELSKFALERGVGRMSMWSANRDVTCGSNYVDTKVVSDSCSGVKEDKFAFTTVLSEGLKGSLSLNASTVTKSDPNAETKPLADDPAASPYQIWSPTGAYLEGTKIVWHHNVYKAKWWTQDDMPDDPVLQSWQTPWELVGPVMPDEKPIPQATLPEGTYPAWSGADAYDAGQHVLFNGVPYKAKWWNQGQSPAASSSNANGSPWTPLTQAEIDALAQ
ncbi:MAG: Chitinase [Candidatus Saccharibacteria bacterium]|nr:Chitinase [Candidatus Saccharibacteria bacterium]